MKSIKTPEKKKAFILTLLIFAIIFVYSLFLGLPYLHQPKKLGVVVNFVENENKTSTIDTDTVSILEPKTDTLTDKIVKKDVIIKDLQSDSIKNTSKTESKLSGHTNVGNKKNTDNDSYSNIYYKPGNILGGSGWELNNRVIMYREDEFQRCNQTGLVIIQITVNRLGSVTEAISTEATTNTDPCLIETAINLAKKFKWRPDHKAPQKQVGYIVLNFN